MSEEAGDAAMAEFERRFEVASEARARRAVWTVVLLFVACFALLGGGLLHTRVSVNENTVEMRRVSGELRATKDSLAEISRVRAHQYRLIGEEISLIKRRLNGMEADERRRRVIAGETSLLRFRVEKMLRELDQERRRRGVGK